MNINYFNCPFCCSVKHKSNNLISLQKERLPHRLIDRANFLDLCSVSGIYMWCQSELNFQKPTSKLIFFFITSELF